MNLIILIFQILLNSKIIYTEQGKFFILLFLSLYLILNVTVCEYKKYSKKHIVDEHVYVPEWDGDKHTYTSLVLCKGFCTKFSKCRYVSTLFT